MIQIWTVDGRAIYAPRPYPELPARAVIGFADVAVGDKILVLVQRRNAGPVIQVAQPQIRQRVAAQAALRSVLPLLAVAPPDGGGGVVVVRRWRSGRCSSVGQRRDAQSFGALPLTGPADGPPLVQALQRAARAG